MLNNVKRKWTSQITVNVLIEAEGLDEARSIAESFADVLAEEAAGAFAAVSGEPRPATEIELLEAEDIEPLVAE